MTEDENEVIEMVVAREAIGGASRRELDQPIIVAVGWIFAPAVVCANRPNRQRRARSRDAIGPVQHQADGKAPERRRPVPFPLQGA